MPRPKFRAKVQKFWILRVTDTTLLFCSSLQWWCGPDLLQGDLSTAPSRYKALRHRSVPSSRRWSLHHLHIPDQLQHPGSLLTTAALSKAVKNSPTWRFVANCLLGGFVFHHFSRLTSSFFFSLPFSRILYSCSYPHLSLLSTKKGCPFPPPCFASHLWGSDVVAPDIRLQFRMWPASHRSSLSSALPGEGKAHLSSTGLLADIRFGPTCPHSGCSSSRDQFVQNYTWKGLLSLTCGYGAANHLSLWESSTAL